MANKVPVVVDQSTGIASTLTFSDTLTDASGNSISGAIRLLSTTTTISLASTGTTNIFTVPSGQQYFITNVLLQVTSATGVSGTASAGVGIAAGEDDIFGSQPLIGLTAADTSFSFASTGTTVVADATEIVKLGIDTAVTGTLEVTAFVFGVATTIGTTAGASNFIGVKAEHTAAFSVSNSTFTDVDYDNGNSSEIFDTNGFHDPGGANPDRFTIPTGLAGKYLVIQHFNWAGIGSAESGRFAGIKHYNSSDTLLDADVAREQFRSSANDSASGSGVEILEMSEGDYVIQEVYHTNGGNFSGTGKFMMMKVG